MKVTQFHTMETSSGRYISAKIEVPGLGEVEIKNCISNETVERAKEEILAALRTKFGQTLEPPAAPENKELIED